MSLFALVIACVLGLAIVGLLLYRNNLHRVRLNEVIKREMGVVRTKAEELEARIVSFLSQLSGFREQIGEDAVAATRRELVDARRETRTYYGKLDEIDRQIGQARVSSADAEQLMKRLWGFRIRLNGLVGNVMRVDVRVRRNQIVVAEVIVLEPPGNEGSRCAGRPSAYQCHFQAGCANRRQQLERENASVIDSVRSAGYAVDIALRLMSGHDDASGESVLKMETLRSERERLLQEVQRALNEFDGDRFAGIGRRAAALESQAHDFRRGMERLVNA